MAFHVSYDIDRTLPLLDQWFQRFSKTRLAFIEDTLNEEFQEASCLLRTNHATRRAYVLNPDFYWKDHAPCNMIYHFLLRPGLLIDDEILQLIIYLRSSDVVNVLPLDIYTACRTLRKMAEVVGVDPGGITFIVGSAHVYEKDWEKFFGTWPLGAKPTAK